MQYQFRTGHHSLRPASGHGSHGRTAAAISVGRSTSKNGSSKRIQHHKNAYGATATQTYDITTASCYCAQQAIQAGNDPVTNTVGFNSAVTVCCNNPRNFGCGGPEGPNPPCPPSP